MHGGYLELIRKLGLRTAELHAAFARNTGDPAFDPEPAVPADIAGWTQRVRAEATIALELLERRSATLPEAAGADARHVLAQRAMLLARIDAHAADRASAARTRLHGDYHLGQVLLVQNDFVIIDFEGEPSRTPAERRQKISPLKDVAGMLRSFDYAMHAALLRRGPERPETLAQLEGAGRQWRAQVERMFFDAYDDVARAAGLASPRAEMRGLLELFLLEKALYELKYEFDNRPDWVRVPLRGISEILSSAK